MIINTMILGNIKTECDQNGNCVGPQEYLSAYGLGSSVMAITILSTSTTYADGLSNLIPHAYGSNRNDLVSVYLNRMLILVSLIFIPFLIPLQFIESLLVKIVQNG
jgi:Na+-driven multidrug efflux pump